MTMIRSLVAVGLREDFLEPRLRKALENVAKTKGRVAVLTGAGISAESGIPTFRGKDGYWTIGAQEYHPQQMATNQMFQIKPWEVWQWYLYRLGVCQAAGPNKAHEAVAKLEELFGDRFTLITQNVDGLHLQAGNSLERTCQIHGNIAYMRCAKDCTTELFPIPEGLTHTDKDSPVAEDEKAKLTCPKCGEMSRPHVLWFDEYYDEELYRFESSIQAAAMTDCLIVIGTSGATNLPMKVGTLCASRGILVIDINPSENPFARMAKGSPLGFALLGGACEHLPPIVEVLE